MRSAKARMLVAAFLYVLGIAGMIFVAHRDRAVPGFAVSYWFLFAGGMVLVAVAALVWPVRDDAGDPGGEGGDAEGSA